MYYFIKLKMYLIDWIIKFWKIHDWGHIFGPNMGVLRVNHRCIPKKFLLGVWPSKFGGGLGFYHTIRRTYGCGGWAWRKSIARWFLVSWHKPQIWGLFCRAPEISARSIFLMFDILTWCSKSFDKFIIVRLPNMGVKLSKIHTQHKNQWHAKNLF